MPNCTLTQKDNTGADFTDCSFAGKDLKGYIFKSCMLTGTDFSGCTFDESTDFTSAFFGKSSTNKATSFAGCDLTKSKFKTPANFGALGSRTCPTNLTGATIPWTLLGQTFQYVDITNAVLKDIPTDLSRIILTGVRWKGYNFIGKKLTNAHFNTCDLTGCIMTGVNLDYVSFIQSTNLTNVKMNLCSLYQTVFEGSTMINTDLSYAIKISNCKFRNTELKGTCFDGNDLRDSSFGIPNMMSTDPNFITSFQFAKLNANFLITNLQKNWQCIDFRNVLISDFNSLKGDLYNLLAQNSLFNSTLNFENARLNGADFSNATFNAINLKDAQMNNVSLVGAKTKQGNELGPRGAIFRLVQDDPVLKSPVDYTSFLNDLTQNNTANAIKVFEYFGYKIGNITITSGTDPVSQNPAWSILDKSVSPNRIFQVVKAPLDIAGKFQLLSYENSPCVFNYAHLAGSFLQGSDLSNSKMENVQLFGATVTFANLSNVNLTGAQLGKNTAIFSLVQDEQSDVPPFTYAAFLTALSTPNLSSIIAIFKHFGYNIANITCENATPPPGADRAWLVKDNQANPARNFSVINMITQQSPKKCELDVFDKDALATSLDGCYMPGVILSEANLTACSLRRCHLYSNAMTDKIAILNKTILVEAVFSGANLYKGDFTSSIIGGTNFSGANLMDANFKGVTFNEGSSGSKVDFSQANLQGTDFSSSTILNASFLSAAICMPVDSSKPTITNGVWLNSVAPGNRNLSDYLTELENGVKLTSLDQPPMLIVSLNLIPGVITSNLYNWLKSKSINVSTTSTISVAETKLTWKITDGATTYTLIPGYDKNFVVAYNLYKNVEPTPTNCNIDFNTDLQIGVVTPSFIEMVKTKSENLIVLSSTATLSSYQRPVGWTLTDLSSGSNYTLWWGAFLVTVPEPKIMNAIFVRSALPKLTTLFSSFGIGLRLQTVIRKTPDPTTNTITWLVNMGKNDAFYTDPGYIQFNVVGNSATAPTSFDIYGFTMRMIGLGNKGEELIQDFDCSVTKIGEDNINSLTILPNNFTKTQNKNNRTPFAQWMWAFNKYPSPPVCVPTSMSYCPAPRSLAAVKKSASKSKTKTKKVSRTEK